MKVVLACSAAGLVPFTYYVYTFTVKAHAEVPDGYSDMTHPSDFRIALASSLGFVTIEKIIKTVLKPIIAPLCKVQQEGKEKEKRVAKMASMLYKFMFFVFSVTWGWIVMKDAKNLPPALGGKGDVKRSFENYPYADHPKNLALYLQVTMGYHFGSLFTCMMEPHRTDFVEMMVHHSATVYLYGGSYLCNAIEAAGYIAFMHDIADVTATIVKFLGESSFKITGIVVFLIHIVIWMYTRNYLFPFFIYDLIKEPVQVWMDFSPFINYFFAYLLALLCFLHYYWLQMFFQVLYHYLSKGKLEDTYNDQKRQLEREEAAERAKQAKKKQA